MRTKLLIFSSFLFLTLSLSAQDSKEKEGLILGGSASFKNTVAKKICGPSQYSKPNGLLTELSTSVNPYLGKELTERSILGVGITYGRIKINNDDCAYFPIHPQSLENIFTIGVDFFYRNYFIQKEKIGFFIQANSAFDFSRVKFEFESQTDESIKNFMLGLDLAAAYALTNKWKLNFTLASFSFHSNHFDKELEVTKSISNTFELRTLLSNLQLGVEYRLNKKR